MLLTLLLGLAGLGAQGIDISFNPNPQVITPGQSFSNTLRVDSASLVHGYSCRILYDSTRLSFVSAARGSLFNGQSIFWWRVETDTLNVLRITCIITESGFVTGPGDLLTLNFTHAQGEQNLVTMDWIKIYDLSGGYTLVTEVEPCLVISGASPSYAKLKCWLQGPWSAGAMLTGQNLLIPLTSPYPADPVTTQSIPADVVDWVLMELRSSPTGQPVLRRSLWLGADGFVRSPGAPYLVLMNTPPGPYHVVLRHRNHLAVMSAAAWQLSASGAPASIDLTTLASIYGGGGVTEVAPGVIALAAGDADGSGLIGPTDRNAHWRLQSGRSGYLSADFSLDGYCSPSDLNAFWRNNSGKGTAVPASR